MQIPTFYYSSMAKKARRRGRPKALPGLLKRQWPCIRAFFPLDEAELVRAARILRGMSGAEFVRQAATETARRILNRDGLGNL